MGRNSQELLGQVKQIESRLVQRIEDVEKNPILQQDQGKGTLVVRLNKIYLVQRIEIEASTIAKDKLQEWTVHCLTASLKI